MLFEHIDACDPRFGVAALFVRRPRIRNDRGAGQVTGAGGASTGDCRLQVGGADYTTLAQSYTTANSGTTVVTQTVLMSGLYVHREVMVPSAGNQDFARVVDVFQNPTTSPITTTVRIVGSLGSDTASIFATSDGTGVASPNDQWIGISRADGSGAAGDLLHSRAHGADADQCAGCGRQYLVDLHDHRGRRARGRIGDLRHRRQRPSQRPSPR